MLSPPAAHLGRCKEILSIQLVGNSSQRFLRQKIPQTFSWGRPPTHDPPPDSHEYIPRLFDHDHTFAALHTHRSGRLAVPCLVLCRLDPRPPPFCPSRRGRFGFVCSSQFRFATYVFGDLVVSKGHVAVAIQHQRCLTWPSTPNRSRSRDFFDSVCQEGPFEDRRKDRKDRMGWRVRFAAANGCPRGRTWHVAASRRMPSVEWPSDDRCRMDGEADAAQVRCSSILQQIGGFSHLRTVVLVVSMRRNVHAWTGEIPCRLFRCGWSRLRFTCRVPYHRLEPSRDVPRPSPGSLLDPI